MRRTCTLVAVGPCWGEGAEPRGVPAPLLAAGDLGEALPGPREEGGHLQGGASAEGPAFGVVRIAVGEARTGEGAGRTAGVGGDTAEGAWHTGEGGHPHTVEGTALLAGVAGMLEQGGLELHHFREGGWGRPQGEMVGHHQAGGRQQRECGGGF